MVVIEDARESDHNACQNWLKSTEFMARDSSDFDL